MFEAVTWKIARRILLIGVGGVICAYMSMHYSAEGNLVKGVALSVLCLLAVAYLAGMNEES